MKRLLSSLNDSNVLSFCIGGVVMVCTLGACLLSSCIHTQAETVSNAIDLARELNSK